MFICIIGTECSGRKTLQQFLSEKRGFLPIQFAGQGNVAQAPTPSDSSPASEEGESLNHVLKFDSSDSMLEFVTRNWRQNFVTIDLVDHETLAPFARRPFCLIINIDAPVMTRFQRCSKMMDSSLEQFIVRHDELTFGGGTEVRERVLGNYEFSHMRISNAFQNIEEFHAHLESIDILNTDRLRPQWDTYFMMLASLAAQRSNCMKRRVGAILVRNNRIVSTGYNGTPRGLLNCNEGGCARCNGSAASGTALDECLCLHAEENALLEAGKDRIGEGSVLYCNTCPCLRCTVKIVQTGVQVVVYHLSYKVDDASAEVFRQAGVTLRKHKPPYWLAQ